MFHITYFTLEIKKAIKSFGYILIGAVLLLIIIGAVSYTASKTLYRDQVMGRMQVGVVQKEDSDLSSLAMKMIGSMESVKSFCDFIPMKEEEAIKSLKEGEIFAAMVIPEGMVEGIMDGSNIPVVVLLPEDLGLESQIFKEVTKAGGQTLGSAQAGIYAITDYLNDNGLSEHLQEMWDLINQRYLSFTLIRETYFKDETVAATGDMSIPIYYTAFGIVLFLLLLGIPCAILLKEDSLALKQKLKLYGISRIEIGLAKILSISVLLTIIMILLGGPLLIFMRSLNLKDLWAEPAGIILLVPAILALASMIYLAYRLGGNPITSVMILFLGSLFLILCSGGFLPLSFLPKEIQTIAPYLPTSIIAKHIGGCLTGTYTLLSTAKTFLICIICCPLGAMVRR